MRSSSVGSRARCGAASMGLIAGALLVACRAAPQPPPSAAPVAPGPRAGLHVPLRVLEVAGVGARAHPVRAVVPLPEGRYRDVAQLDVVDAEGRPVPAQVEVLNRHWAKDGSLRHVLVHFEASVSASGASGFALEDGARRVEHADPITVQEDARAIVIASKALRLELQRSPFAIVTPVGPLGLELIDDRGALERSWPRDDVEIVIEERGPLRAVVRVDAPAKMIAPGRVRHGWAVRLYAYAGKPWIQVDVQLQNSPKDDVFGAPMYFDALALTLPGAAGAPLSVRGDDPGEDPSGRAPGVLSTPELSASIARFWEMWPNGLERTKEGQVRIELFPPWSARRYQGALSPLGLHWLDDMQHVTKSALIAFGPVESFEALAATFSLRPLPIVPTSWYATTEVTLDMGGVFPRAEPLGGPIHRRPQYARYHHGDRPIPLRFGWDNFGVDLYRKGAPSTAGDWPYSSARAFLTEDPAEIFAAEDFAMGDINVLPQQMARYDYAKDFDRLRLTENPYFGWSWRHFDGRHGSDPSPHYRPGSGAEAKPRDDQHGWTYHLEEAYYATGNPWIRDYYRFIAQFRRTRLHQRDPFPDMVSRAVGHSLSHALQAYRVTGDLELLGLVGEYLLKYIAPRLDPRTGGYVDQAEAVFQVGYLARAMVTYLEETPDRDPRVLKLLGDFVRWNMGSGRWGYYVEPGKVNTRSDGTSMTFCDPQSYYGLVTNDAAVLADVEAYVREGIGGGERPIVDVSGWAGDFNGRITAPMLEAQRGRKTGSEETSMLPRSSSPVRAGP